jgi:hypothetical protein
MAGVDGVLTTAARISFQSAEHGDLRGLDTLVSHLSGSLAPEDRAWRLALETVRWSFDARRGSAPLAIEARLMAESGPGAGAGLAQVCAVMERVAFATWNGPMLAEWIELHASLVETAGSRSDPGDIVLAAARLWQRLLAGETAGIDAASRALSDQASRQSAAATVIEANVIRALAALSDGALDDAIDLSRRASRMAQSEALSHHEYLANITLARVRRYSGRPHLALHILAALDRVAPSTWSGWIGWECLLAGGARASRDDTPDVPSVRAERPLRELLESARSGDRRRFKVAATAAIRAAQIWPALAAEVTGLLAALDPSRDPIPSLMAGWIHGETATIPLGLHGVGISQGEDPQSETATAYVLARPGESGRRFLVPGLALAPPARMLIRDSVRSGARTETGIAALALAGEGGDTRDAIFRRVYGFTFVPYRHRAVLDTLCHRMRALLGSAGDVRRDEAEASVAAEAQALALPPAASTTPSMTLVLREAIVVPDMRCVLPAADRVLRSLALLGATSASAAAESLRMPLRTVQAVLQQLVAEGACTIERDGRRVAYRIEDTTFTEVTVA